jgi:hypothetical protein
MMANLTGRARLLRAAKDLAVRWYEVQEVWRDSQTAQFEKRVMSPLEANVRVTAQAMERLEGLLAQAKNDCRGGDY